MPKKSQQAQSQSDSILLTPYSDGFVGKEGAPTGLYMPIKQSSRRKNLIHNMSSGIGELTLVATKLKEVMQGEPKSLPRIRQNASPLAATVYKSPRAHNHPISNRLENSMSVNSQRDHLPISEEELMARTNHEGHSQQQAPRFLSQRMVAAPERERTTPAIVSDDDNISREIGGSSSPLKRKQSQCRISQKSADRRQVIGSGTQGSLFRRKESTQLAVSQQLKMVSAVKQTPRRANTFEVNQELRMVSVWKRAPGVRVRYADDDDEEDDATSSEDGSILENSPDPEPEDERIAGFSEENLIPLRQEMEAGLRQGEGDKDVAIVTKYCINKGVNEEKHEWSKKEVMVENEDEENIGTEAEQSQPHPKSPRFFHNSEVRLACGTLSFEKNLDNPLNAASDIQDGALGLWSAASKEPPIEKGTQSQANSVVQFEAGVIAEQDSPRQSADQGPSSSLPDTQRIGLHLNSIPCPSTAGRHSQTSPNGYSRIEQYQMLSSQQDEHVDGLWRPQVPISSGVNMEVDDDIVDVSTPPSVRLRVASNRLQLRGRKPKFGSKPLNVALAKPTSPLHKGLSSQSSARQDSGASTILGETQNFVRHDSSASIVLGETGNSVQRAVYYEIPESQVISNDDDKGTQDTNVYISQTNYFDNSTYNLQNPQDLKRSKSKSIHSRMQFTEEAQSSSMLEHRGNAQPVQCKIEGLTTLDITSSQEFHRRSLFGIPRQSSQVFGTISGRKRTSSLSFKPPFKK